MPKQIKLEPHLSVDAIEERYWDAQDVVARSQWQIIWLIGQGKRSAEVAEVTGYSAAWIRQVVQRYNQAGPDSVGDRRHHNPGQARLLSPEQEGELGAVLDAAAARGERWTSHQVAVWMRERLKRPVQDWVAWCAMQRLGFTLQQPRPRHAQAAAMEQATFKKTWRRSRRP
jgi:transposase